MQMRIDKPVVKERTNLQRLVDLREILRYVPHYRDKVFGIAFDGVVPVCSPSLRIWKLAP